MTSVRRSRYDRSKPLCVYRHFIHPNDAARFGESSLDRHQPQAAAYSSEQIEAKVAHQYSTFAL